MRQRSIRAEIGPAKPPPAPAFIPTTEALIHGETVYLEVGDLWLTGGRGDGNTGVNTRDGEGGAHEGTYRWTLMQDSRTAGSGPVRYGDIVYLALGTTGRWLSGGRGNHNEGVMSVPFEEGLVDTFGWTVMQSRTTTGTGEVKRGDAIYLKIRVKNDKGVYVERWLTGGRGDEGQQDVYTRGGEDGKKEANYQWTSVPVSYARSFAVFAEYALKEKPMVAGMNTRVFNRVEARSPDGAIELDTNTGVVTLPPGTYRITGFSSTAYKTDDEKHPGKVRTEAFACGGYCRVRYGTGSKDPILIGGISTANAIPSLVDGWFTTTVETKILLEHQCGDDVEVEGVLLQPAPGPYDSRVFARLAFERV